MPLCITIWLQEYSLSSIHQAAHWICPLLWMVKQICKTFLIICPYLTPNSNWTCKRNVMKIMIGGSEHQLWLLLRPAPPCYFLFLHKETNEVWELACLLFYITIGSYSRPARGRGFTLVGIRLATHATAEYKRNKKSSYWNWS